MKCQHCEKSFTYKAQLYLIDRNGCKVSASFCCYECYLEFWKDNTDFIPLKEYKQPTPILYVPEPVKKKRIFRNHNCSYKKNAYCF